MTREEELQLKLERIKQWRIEHPEEQHQRAAKYRETHREHIREYMRKYAEKNREKLRESARLRGRTYREADPEKRRTASREWNERNAHTATDRYKASYKKFPERFCARVRLRRAVHAGKIVRPGACSKCGKACKPEAHHPDYSKPFEVIWLCRSCHGLHRRFSE